MTLGDKIKEIRREKNMSQTSFGSRVVVTGKAISAYETGRAKTYTKVLDSISRKYHTTILYTSGPASGYVYAKIKSIRKSLLELESMLIDYSEIE